jgi:hypothetical protein
VPLPRQSESTPSSRTVRATQSAKPRNLRALPSSAALPSWVCSSSLTRSIGATTVCTAPPINAPATRSRSNSHTRPAAAASPRPSRRRRCPMDSSTPARAASSLIRLPSPPSGVWTHSPPLALLATPCAAGCGLFEEAVPCPEQTNYYYQSTRLPLPDGAFLFRPGSGRVRSVGRERIGMAIGYRGRYQPCVSPSPHASIDPILLFLGAAMKESGWPAMRGPPAIVTSFGRNAMMRRLLLDAWH